MNTSDQLTKTGSIRNPLLILLLSVAVFVLVDNLIFRTALYARVVPPVTTSGRLAQFMLAEEGRPSSGKLEVLTTGSSRMQFALSPEVADTADPSGRLHLVNGSIHAGTEKWTYYILKRLDPTHRRYAAIVISDSEYKVIPFPDDKENDFLCAQAMAPFISLRDWPEFTASFTDPAVRENVKDQGLFASHGVGMDILLDAGRITQRILRGGAKRLVTDEGPPENVLALATKPENASMVHVISLPAHFDSFQRQNADECFRYPSSEQWVSLTDRNARFHQQWLTKIVELYKDSPTKLIFVQMPRWPVPLPQLTPLASAPDIRDLLPQQRNVMFLGKNEFTFLEKPMYFWDLYHLNKEGRRIFSERLGRLVREIVVDHQTPPHELPRPDLLPILEPR
jgi:hypothetical protein